MDIKVEYPLTIIYLSLKWCGFAYRLFESIHGKAQYHPLGSYPIPEHRMFAQYHSPQTSAILYYNDRDIRKNRYGRSWYESLLPD